MRGIPPGWLTPLSRHAALVLSAVLMVAWLVAYRQLSPMGGEFFQASRPGLRGLALYLTGRYGDAARAYRAAQRGHEIVEYGSDQAGYRALLAGDLALAEQRAQTTLLLVPTAVEPLVTLAELALEHGRYEDALVHLSGALARRPDHQDALYLSAVALALTARHGPAIDLMNRALRHPVTSARQTTFLRLLEVAGDLAERPPPDRPACLLAHLHRYLRIFDPSHAAPAMAYARQAIAAGDRPADAYLTLAVMHDKLGNYVEALRAAREAIEADPQHAEAYRWAATEARNRGDLLLEYRMIRSAFESAPADAYYLSHLEQVVMGRLGDPHTMAALMAVALERDPRNAAAHQHLAQALRLLGDARGYDVHARTATELRHAARAGAEPRGSRP